MSNWQHVYPVLEDHKLEGFDCPCEPSVDFEYQIVVHHSFDIVRILTIAGRADDKAS